MDLNEQAKQMLEERIKRFKEFAKLQPDHPFTVANQHMLELSAETSWPATGTLSMTGVVWWALTLTADLADSHYVIYSSTGGPEADFSIATAAVTGYFFVDPSTLNGEYQFTLASLAGVSGELSFNLYDMNWSQVASFLGLAGPMVSKLSGIGTLTYH